MVSFAILKLKIITFILSPKGGDVNFKRMVEKFKIKPRFIVDALRNCGYTNDTAIADIIDNSLEVEVNSSNIKVEFTKTKDDKGVRRTINEIRIIDDGCGMDMETLKEAMSLGAETGKDENNLGMYGAGLKTASLSIGKSLRVLTKTEDGELLMAYLDIDIEYSDENPFVVEYSVVNKTDNFYKMFESETNSTHGTIVVIGKLDKLKNKDAYSFRDYLSKKLRLYFNKFIETDYCNIYVEGVKLKFYDTIGKKTGLNTRLLQEEKISINGIDAIVKAWYVPLNCTIKGNKNDDYIGRSNRTCGLYIYRQRRLVGWGLNLGFLSDTATIDHWYNGLRVEVFLDGKADSVFGTTFTKMISEKSADDIDQAFSDRLKQIIRPLTAIAKASQQSETPKEDVPKEITENMKKVTDYLNKNNLLSKGMNTRGKNEKRGGHTNMEKEHKPQENPNPTKKRKEIWFEGFDFINDGETGLMYRPDIREGKNWILINRDHIFYKDIFSQLNYDIQSKIATMLACEIPSKKRCCYWEDEKTQQTIDEYNQLMSDSLRAALSL